MYQYLLILNLFLSFTLSLLLNNTLCASDELITNISAPELKYLMSKTKIVVINSMSSIEFDRQHIPGSINIPLINMSSSKQLPKDKDTPLAFYCMKDR